MGQHNSSIDIIKKAQPDNKRISGHLQRLAFTAKLPGPAENSAAANACQMLIYSVSVSVNDPLRNRGK